MPRPVQQPEEVSQNLVKNLNWRVATRDDRGVMRHVHEAKELDAVYSLTDGGLLDRFWYFLELTKVTGYWQSCCRQPSPRVNVSDS